MEGDIIGLQMVLKSGIDEKCGKLFKTCFQPRVALFNAYGKKLGEWPKII